MGARGQPGVRGARQGTYDGQLLLVEPAAPVNVDLVERLAQRGVREVDFVAPGHSKRAPDLGRARLALDLIGDVAELRRDLPAPPLHAKAVLVRGLRALSEGIGPGKEHRHLLLESDRVLANGLRAGLIARPPAHRGVRNLGKGFLDCSRHLLLCCACLFRTLQALMGLPDGLGNPSFVDGQFPDESSETAMAFAELPSLENSSFELIAALLRLSDCL